MLRRAQLVAALAASAPSVTAEDVAVTARVTAQPLLSR